LTAKLVSYRVPKVGRKAAGRKGEKQKGFGSEVAGREREAEIEGAGFIRNVMSGCQETSKLVILSIAKNLSFYLSRPVT